MSRLPASRYAGRASLHDAAPVPIRWFAWLHVLLLVVFFAWVLWQLGPMLRGDLVEFFARTLTGLGQ